MRLNKIPPSVPLGRYSTFGERLRVAINRAQTTQSQLARDLGVAQPSINAWVNDKSVPGSNFIKPLTEALRVSADWLLDIDPPKKDDDELDPVDHLIRHSLKQTASDLDTAINRLERITGKAPVDLLERRRDRQKPHERLGHLVGNDKSAVWSDDDV